MGRIDVGLKCIQLRSLIEKREYQEAYKVAEKINLDKVTSIVDLKVIASVYERLGKYEEAKDVLLRSYEKKPTKMVIYRLAYLCVKTNEFEDAEFFYQEFSNMAPNSPDRYILRYGIDRAKGVDYLLRIATLQKLKQIDYMEEWGYELAKVYHKAGLYEECIQECNDLITWFGDGIIVEKAQMLRQFHEEGKESLDPYGVFDEGLSKEELEARREQFIADTQDLRSQAAMLAEQQKQQEVYRQLDRDLEKTVDLRQVLEEEGEDLDLLKQAVHRSWGQSASNEYETIKVKKVYAEQEYSQHSYDTERYETQGNMHEFVPPQTPEEVIAASLAEVLTEEERGQDDWNGYASEGQFMDSSLDGTGEFAQGENEQIIYSSEDFSSTFEQMEPEYSEEESLPEEFLSDFSEQEMSGEVLEGYATEEETGEFSEQYTTEEQAQEFQQEGMFEEELEEVSQEEMSQEFFEEGLAEVVKEGQEESVGDGFVDEVSQEPLEESTDEPLQGSVEEHVTGEALEELPQEDISEEELQEPVSESVEEELSQENSSSIETQEVSKEHSPKKEKNASESEIEQKEPAVETTAATEVVDIELFEDEAEIPAYVHRKGNEKKKQQIEPKEDKKIAKKNKKAEPKEDKKFAKKKQQVEPKEDKKPEKKKRKSFLFRWKQKKETETTSVMDVEAIGKELDYLIEEVNQREEAEKEEFNKLPPEALQEREPVKKKVFTEDLSDVAPESMVGIGDSVGEPYIAKPKKANVVKEQEAKPEAAMEAVEYAQISEEVSEYVGEPYIAGNVAEAGEYVGEPYTAGSVAEVGEYVGEPYIAKRTGGAETAQLNETQDVDAKKNTPEAEQQEVAEEPIIKEAVEVTLQEEVSQDDFMYISGVDLWSYFAAYQNDKRLCEDIQMMMEGIKSGKRSMHMIITCKDQERASQMGRDVAKAMKGIGFVEKQQVARVTAEKLNRMHLEKNYEKLEGGFLLVEGAKKMTADTAQSIMNMINEMGNQIVVILTDARPYMDDLMNEYKMMRRYFPNDLKMK